MPVFGGVTGVGAGTGDGVGLAAGVGVDDGRIGGPQRVPMGQDLGQRERRTEDVVGQLLAQLAARGGAELQIESRAGEGTTANLELPVA